MITTFLIICTFIFIILYFYIIIKKKFIEPLSLSTPKLVGSLCLLVSLSYLVNSDLLFSIISWFICGLVWLFLTEPGYQKMKKHYQNQNKKDLNKGNLDFIMQNDDINISLDINSILDKINNLIL